MDWAIKVIKADNGFVLEYEQESEDYSGVMKHHILVEYPPDGDETITTQKLLHEIMAYFDLFGSRYDKKRVVVKFEKGDKYEKND